MLEAQFADTKIVDRLKTGEFVAPVYLQDRLEQQIRTLATLCAPLAFEIHEDAFCLTADRKSDKLVDIGHQHKCHLEIQTSVANRICKIPKAATQDHVSSSLTATAIDIRLEDLSEQKVTKCSEHLLVSLAEYDLGRPSCGLCNIAVSGKRYFEQSWFTCETRVYMQGQHVAKDSF